MKDGLDCRPKRTKPGRIQRKKNNIMNLYWIVTYIDKDNVTKTQVISNDNLDWFKQKVVADGGTVISWEIKQ